MPTRLLLASAAVLVLAACTTPHGPMHHRMAGGTDPCVAHRDAKTPQEKRAAAEAHIRQMHGSVDDAHVERHLRMMDQRCGPAGTRS